MSAVEFLGWVIGFTIVLIGALAGFVYLIESGRNPR